ncbi:MAG: hypothetical protein WDA03_01000 [Trueperaceae bacterium]
MPGRAGSSRLRWAALLALLALLLAGQGALAARIGIDAANDPNSRLEIRTITLPDGTEVQLYVLQGEGMRVSIDDSLLEADHVEVDLTNRLVRVIGFGRYTSGGEVVEAHDLVIDLRDESFAGDDVLIISDAVTVQGDRASRVPGLIRVAMGQFSPCTRCGQDIEDYGFEAETLEIYPGDRIVAYEVTVLVRAAAVLSLPIMVLPIGPQDRQPRLEWVTGTATQRARITLSWPYVVGADSYGDVGVRYYADVLPGGSGAGDFFLGGAVLRSYVGGFLQHRFYTDTGKGSFTFDFTPAFQTTAGRTEQQFQVRLVYADEEVLGPPRTTLLVERNDARRPSMWEASLAHEAVVEGWRGRYSAQVFVDLEPGLVRSPSYAGRSVPLQTLSRVQLEPDDLRSLNLGAVRLERFLVDLGAFQDVSNSLNRSAAMRPTATAGRATLGHTITLAPLPFWSGFTLEGRTFFTGYYYSTAERQVEWLTAVTARQAFGRTGSLSLTFTRNVREGETPFRFDLLPYRSRTDVRSQLRLDPTAWLRLEQTGGYVFFDDRNPGEVGWLPLVSTATLLHNLNWITLTLRNEYDPNTGDPGSLDARLVLRTRGRLYSELDVLHSHDLAVRPDRVTGVPRDTTSTSAAATAGLTNIVELSAETAYRYFPAPPEAGEPPDHWDDLNLRLTLGTLRHDDRVPGLAVKYAHDLDLDRASAFEVAAAVTAGPLQFDASQRLSLPTGQLARSQLRLAWPGVVAAQADGLMWLPTGWLGLPQPAPYARNLSFTIEEAPLRGSPTWQVRYSTRLDPALGSSPTTYGFRNSLLTGRVLLTDRAAGPVRFSVDGFAELMWQDDAQPSTFLRRANVRFGVDIYDRVGLQGTVGYSGLYSAAAQEVVSGRLSLQEVALVVRPLDTLYVGAVITDVWDLTGNDASQPAFNLQPTFVVAWNRCCWALYGSWNSRTGAVAITLTTPGADQGLGHIFDTGWIIPRREP